MGKLITQDEVKKITSKHIASAKQVEESGKQYVESEYYSIEALELLINGVPKKSIKGVRIKFGSVEREGKECLTTVLELVTKNKTAKYRAMSEPTSTCPFDCATDS